MNHTVRRWIGLVLFVTLVFCSASGLAGNKNSSDKVMERGYEAYDQGDYETAYQCFLRASELGDLYALYNLGVMYENGLGVDQSVKKALKCYVIFSQFWSRALMAALAGTAVSVVR